MKRRYSPRRMTIPTHGHPLVRLAFRLAVQTGRSYRDMAEASGVPESTIRHWRKSAAPTLPNIEAVLTALGVEIYARPKQ